MAGALTPLGAGSGQPLVQAASFDTSNKGVSLDPRILEILQGAAYNYPLKVEAFSGVQDRSGGTTNHPGGYAIDVRIYDDKGVPLANSPADAARRGQNLADNFRVYEQYAQAARDIQTRTHPELNDTFRWGGYFMAGDTPFDLMHFDINPKLHGATGGGDWDTGLSNEARKLLKGADSVGMHDVVRQQLADLGFKGPNAVTEYQKARGLGVDGIIGPETTKRLALDVAPPADIPNPYGLAATFDAIKKGDPKALEANLHDTMSQVMAAHWAGVPDEQIATSFNSYLDHLSPAEQANLRGNFNAGMGGLVPGVAGKFGLASGPLQDAVNSAIQRSQNLADSLISGQLVGKTTQADVNLAMQNMAKVNPGKSYNDLAARAVQGAELGKKLTPGAAQPPPAAVAGAPPAAKPPGQPIDPKALLTALQTLIPGMPGLGAGAVGMQGAPPGPQGPTYNARPPMAAAPGAPGVMTGLTPRSRPDTNESYTGAPGMQVNRPGNVPPNPTLRPGEGGAGLQPGGPAPADNLDMRTRPDGSGGVVQDKPYQRPAADAAGLAALLGRGGSAFGNLGTAMTNPPPESYVSSPGDRAMQTALNAAAAGGGGQAGWRPGTLAPLQQMANQIDAGAGVTGSRNAGQGAGGSTAVTAYAPLTPQGPAYDDSNDRATGGGNSQPTYPNYAPAPATSAADLFAMLGPPPAAKPNDADRGLDSSPRQYYSPPPEVDQYAYDDLADGSRYNQMLAQPPRSVAAPVRLTPQPQQQQQPQQQEDRVAETQRDLPDYGSYGDGNGGTIFIPMQLY